MTTTSYHNIKNVFNFLLVGASTETNCFNHCGVLDNQQ